MIAHVEENPWTCIPCKDNTKHHVEQVDDGVPVHNMFWKLRSEEDDSSESGVDTFEGMYTVLDNWSPLKESIFVQGPCSSDWKEQNFDERMMPVFIGVVDKEGDRSEKFLHIGFKFQVTDVKKPLLRN